MSEYEVSTDSAPTEKTRKWQPLGSIERRVLGTLVEKAKTTDTYPMSLNALTNGCNQKSNRDPQMSLEPHQVEEALEKLRSMGAVAEVQGDSRVAKYRHYAYDWLGVDKYEIAVMAELMLRGAQSVGELRGRAARMEAIADVAALRPVLESLIEKDLVISLTPPGRGQMVTHNLYLPDQLEKVKRSIGSTVAVNSSESLAASTSSTNHSPRNSDDVAELRAEVSELRSEVTQLKSEIEDLRQLMRG
ncbi:MAG: YceH family protein [Planctomycetales bacterium]|nr:YceH family protein [Planctomycetales bacterium]